MSVLAFVNGTAILPDRLLPRAVVVCDRGRIVSVAADGKPPRGAQIIDTGGSYVAPGFIDLHVHGGAGADFMDGTPEAIEKACACHLRHGTTTIYPTTTTGAPDLIDAMLAACQAANAPNFGGVHLYGPYFAAAKVGCHDALGRRDPTRREYARYFATGLVKIATCAAELPGAEDFYRAARRHRCLVTDASRAVDMPSGRYRFGHERQGTWFESDGAVGRAAGGLASSVVGMDHMVRHFQRVTEVPLPDVVRMATLTPAERVGIARRTGSVEAGKRADLLVLSKSLHIRRVFLRGREVTAASG